MVNPLTVWTTTSPARVRQEHAANTVLLVHRQGHHHHQQQHQQQQQQHQQQTTTTTTTTTSTTTTTTPMSLWHRRCPKLYKEYCRETRHTLQRMAMLTQPGVACSSFARKSKVISLAPGPKTQNVEGIKTTLSFLRQSYDSCAGLQPHSKNGVQCVYIYIYVCVCVYYIYTIL